MQTFLKKNTPPSNIDSMLHNQDFKYGDSIYYHNISLMS